MTSDSRLQCIYCLETKPASRFNREHVIPAAFGGFTGALVLSSSVCESCNTYFGSTIDLTLARGSDEGFRRYVWNVRPPEQIEKFRYDSATFRFDGEGDYRGCFLRLIADPSAPDGFRATPIDQVGFPRSDGDGFVWIRLEEVMKGDWKNRDDLIPEAGIKIYAKDPNTVIDYFEKQGMSFPNWRPMVREGKSGDEMSVLQVGEITKDLRRAIAKISFNYLSYTHGRQFALRPHFDQVRRFVRYGEGGEGLVDFDDESPIRLPPDTPDGHRPVLHLVTVESVAKPDAVIAQVSLFGGLRYLIVLSAQMVDGLRLSGHLYDVGGRCVHELGNRRQL